MMPGTILVVGGTGMLGMPVARQLQADGFDVRVFTRDVEKAARKLGPSFAVFKGNAGEPGTLERAVAGCSGIHINLRGLPVGEITFERVERQGTVNIVATAVRAGVGRLTYLSDLHALAAENQALPQIAAKLAAEAAIRASGIPYAIFRATVFMEALSHSFRQGRLLAPSVHSRYHLLAADDYAKMVSRVFQEPTAPSSEIAVYGPQAVDFHEAIRRYSAVLHPGMRVYSVPVWAASLLGSLTRDPFTRTTAKVLRMYRSGEPGDPQKADRSLGTPTTTFDDWLRQQRQEESKAA
jgi:uncharacterized protein YbjT (DUF2867 family)